jgi:hypothetical protein
VAGRAALPLDKSIPHAKSRCPKDRHPELAYWEQIPSQKDKTNPGAMNERP